MPPGKNNIVLIGMPGSGKSTVGVILAKRLSHDFVDTDVLIQTTEHRSLQEILDQDGVESFRAIEERVLLDLDADNHVISTGGSAVYSEAAMERLRQKGVVIYLRVTLATLRARVPDYSARGVARRPGQSFEDLYQERTALYERHAEITVDCDGLSQEQVCERIEKALASP